jgi:hypothetical protein
VRPKCSGNVKMSNAKSVNASSTSK